MINCSKAGGDIESQTTKYFTKLNHNNFRNIQQTQYSLKTTINKLSCTFYTKQLTFIKYTTNFTPL